MGSSLPHSRFSRFVPAWYNAAMKVFTKRKQIILPLTLAALLAALNACSDAGRITDAPSSQPTPSVSVGEGSLAEGRMLDWSLTLLHLADSGDNLAISPAALTSDIAALRLGVQGKPLQDTATALGAQDMSPKQINDAALKARQTMEKLKLGRYSALWSLFVGEKQPVLESYLSEGQKALQMNSRFEPFSGETGKATLNEWADTGTAGMVSDLNFDVPSTEQPFFVDLFMADPDWQMALDPAKTRPQPFFYEDGDKSAVPTLVVTGRCGIYDGPEGAMAVLPLAGDEARLVVLFPKEDGVKLTDFYATAQARHDEWLTKATWGSQRVLLPRFSIGYRGSIRGPLGAAGMGSLFAADTDFSAMGHGLHPADILHDCRLIIDESGVNTADPKASYRSGVDDGIPTLAVNRPFLVLLEKTDTGAVLLAGAVRDPLAALK